MKNTIRRLFSLITVIALVFSLTSCRGGSATTPTGQNDGSSSSTPTITWRIGHNNPEDHYWTVYMEKFGDMVEEKSNGSIQVEVYHSSQLGDDNAMGEMIRNGNLDMFITGACIPGNWWSPMSMMEMAGLFDSWEHVEASIYGEPGEMMAKGCEEAGMILFDSWMRTSWNAMTTKPVNSLADFDGLKCRVTGMDIWIAHMEGTYGLSATPMAFSEVFTGLQQGVVEGVFNPISSMYTMRFHEVCDYLIMTGANYDFAPILVSPQSWDKLSEEQKAVMEECKLAIREEVNDYIKTEDDIFIELMKKDNPDLQIIELDQQEILEAGYAVAADCAAMVNGTELYEAIRALAP